MKTLETLLEGLAEIPVLDAHSHLLDGNLGARGLHDILLHHVVVSDLYAAGCPSGNRITQYPGWPRREEIRSRIKGAIPYLDRIRNTSSMWALKTILSDLYRWKDPITLENWQNLDQAISEHARDRAFHRSILDRINVKRTCTDYARRFDRFDDRLLQYSLAWGMFARTQWAEFDTALYDLERTWGKQPEGANPLGSARQPTTRHVVTVADVRDAIRYYVSVIPFEEIISTQMVLSTDIDYRVPTYEEMDRALENRSTAGPREQSTYAAYVLEHLLNEIERAEHPIVIQFIVGAEPLPFETASRVSQRTIGQLAEIVGRHPKLRFQVFLGSKHANQSLCTMCRELPNLSLAGFWRHNFFPQSIRHVLSERLDMVPVNKQIAFASDAYVVEWSYASMMMLRQQMARVFSEKIDQGQYTLDEALSIARSILFESPQGYGMVPRDEPELAAINQG
jgi:hypothetical protein